MRRLGFVFFIALFVPTVLAQNRPQLEPLPEPPGPPAIPAAEEPSVRIPVQEADKVEEIRDGVLMVTPPDGKPYYLIDTGGNGTWMRRDSLDSGLRVPMWPIMTFD
jgi:hypothetical protein